MVTKALIPNSMVGWMETTVSGSTLSAPGRTAACSAISLMINCTFISTGSVVVTGLIAPAFHASSAFWRFLGSKCGFALDGASTPTICHRPLSPLPGSYRGKPSDFFRQGLIAAVESDRHILVSAQECVHIAFPCFDSVDPKLQPGSVSVVQNCIFSA